ARLEIVGQATQVDRDILEKLDAPLGHLLRNAVDHGIESPEERRTAGKPAEAVVHLEARHSAGMLQIIVSDDGCGIDLDKLREAVVRRNLTNAETARKLSEAELLEFLEGRQHFNLDGRQVGLVTAHQVLEGGEPELAGDELPVIVVGDHSRTYGLVADRFLGERELVVQPLDARLGKIQDISAGALMEDGSPVLIVDVEDLIRSVDKLVSGGQLNKVRREGAAAIEKTQKR